MIANLLPGTASFEMFSDTPEAWAFPSEAALMANACAERRREFGTVRHCARQALHQIGVPAVPILPDADGVPRWPTGIVGSMTHCRGYRAAVVVSSRLLHGVGIDAEPDSPLPLELFDLVLRNEERAELRATAGELPVRNRDRLLFCAKEAVFKAWFPITRSWLDFLDVSVTLRADGTFRALVHVAPVAGIGPVFTGRWVVGRGLILAATSVSPRGWRPTRRAAPRDRRLLRDGFLGGIA
jgi:4'-phosphopantetheinyl transferase EntD